MAHRIINNEADLADFTRMLANLKLPVTFEWRHGRDRTLDQNRLQFLWAREVSEQRDDVRPEEVRCEWKLHHGVPIMRADSSEFREIYDLAIRPLPYEMKLKTMLFYPVTSEMNVRQMVRYLDAVQRECLEQGLRVTDPDPELASYQASYRMKDAA